MRNKVWLGWALLVGLVWTWGCGGSPSPGASYAPGAAEAPAAEPGYGGPAPAPAADDAAFEAEEASGGAAEKRAMQPSERPGLGTAWGENVESRVQEGVFVRANRAQPFAVAAIWYNDRQGANAMAGTSDYRAYDQAVVPAFNGGISVHLKGEQGQVLPGFQAGGRQYVIGEAGTRYTIVVHNRSDYRFEAVASVDGLDVVDGRPAAYAKRGYILDPRATLEIDGFRRSADTVAAFRFSSVRESYTAQSGKGTRNVGVIGVALFHERGSSPVWSQGEIDRRHQADPFPGRYAVPPQ